METPFESYLLQEVRSGTLGLVMEPDLANLLRAITSGITQRGFYVLFDDRLDLICGKGCSKDPADPTNAEKIRQFATQNNWAAKVEEHGLTFRISLAPTKP